MARCLLIRPGAIGDFILSLPALESLCDDYTEVWAATPNVALARFADRARSISSVGLDRLGITHADDVIERLRQFDCIHSWYGANRPEFRELVTSLGLPFTFHQALPSGPKHAIDFYLEQAGAAEGATPHLECRLVKPTERAIIHPFASNTRKRWPLENFQALASHLEHHMEVQWCRGPEEELDHAYYVENLYELGAWIASATLYIGNDTGITHLAAAVGTPVIAFFGPTDPATWAPRGKNVSIESIASTPEEIIRRTPGLSSTGPC